MRKSAKISISIISAIALIVVVFGIYVSDYYHADADAIDSYVSESAEMHRIDNDMIAFTPENSEAGIIFYPGGKVEYESYIPLMKALSDRGITTVLIKMPFNLAVLGIDKADGVIEAFPDIDSWYMAGHSLGGSMAATYISKNIESFDGLILLASYSTASLSSGEIEVLSIYGSEDGVLNMEKYDENKKNLPPDYKEHAINGGNHAFFGMYGSQDGDGEATITNIQQIEFTADYIEGFVK